MSRHYIFLLLSLTMCIGAIAYGKPSPERHRIFVSTDIGGTDPDDNQSMTHLLMYANEFDIEGLVSSPSFGDGSKEEILRMISLYDKDRDALAEGLNATYGTSRGTYPATEYLESITKQGRKGNAPLCGYYLSTEGSEWLVKCARKEDPRPLWVLVWGGLEDVAQALHDAPDIADKIRIYWIGGPNKKWGSSAYSYIAENFPSLWFIENNATYRGFIGSTNDASVYESGFWNTFMKDAGALGNDFIRYYDGIVKMGDTPSLLFLMNGDSDNPEADHWGGRFEPMQSTPRYIVTGPLVSTDTIPCYALIEWRLAGPHIDIRPDSVCFTLTVDKQEWPGYYAGDGTYIVRYAPKAPAVLNYTIASDIDRFPAHDGIFTVDGKWPSDKGYCNKSRNIKASPIPVTHQNDSGEQVSTWYTDIQDYSTKWQGAPTIARWRNDIMKDWSKRFLWLKQYSAGSHGLKK